MENLKNIVEQLFVFNRTLLGAGFDNALEFLGHLIKLDVIEVPSGTEMGTWKVPDEWVVRDAWVKLNGEKILDYQQPLSLMVGSLPFQGKVTREELQKHLYYSETNATPYAYKFYERDWGFAVPHNFVKRKIEQGCENGVCVPELKSIDPGVGKIQIDGIDYSPKFENALAEGEYEVFIDTEYKPGTMKIGVHTIKGESDREILLFAHLDHPFQANDNLSAVACLLDLANRIKAEHTIKIIFCPETIGSIAYAHMQDISKVDFVIAVEICGNDNTILFQKAFDVEHRLNRVVHCALQIQGKPYRKARFRNLIGSDEYYFNDPKVGIPGILLTRYPDKAYHTSEDTPDKLNYEKITETGDLILKIIEIWEQDFIPERLWSGALMRSRFGIQSESKQLNLNWDYLFYSMDGKRSLAELCADFELNFEVILETIKKIENENFVRRIGFSKVGLKKIAGKKHKGLSRKADVSR